MPETTDQLESAVRQPPVGCPATKDGMRQGVNERLQRVAALLAGSRLPDALRTRIRRKLMVFKPDVGSPPPPLLTRDAAAAPKTSIDIPASFSEAQAAWSHLLWADRQTDVPSSSEPIRPEVSTRTAAVLTGMLRWAMTRTEMVFALDELEWWAARCRPTVDRETQCLLAAEVLAALGSASETEAGRLLSAFQTIRPLPRLAVQLYAANVNLRRVRRELLQAVGYPEEVVRDVL